jgi:hypothetical protein
MHKRLTAMLAAVMLIAGSGLAFGGNRSYSTRYDVNKPAIVKGIITTVDWSFPYCFLTIEGTGGDGRLKEFRIELGQMRALQQKGWRRDTLREGDTVTVTGWSAHGDYSRIKARALRLHDKSRDVGLTFSEAISRNLKP